jgi:aspartate kinase
MKILKFGGTSVGSPESIRQVLSVISRECRAERAVLVFSAMGSTTDRLVEAARTAVKGDLSGAMHQVDQLETYHQTLAGTFLKTSSRMDALLKTMKRYFDEIRAIVKSLEILRDFSALVQDRFLAYGELLSTTILVQILQERGFPAEWTDARKLILTNSEFTQAEPIWEGTRERIKAGLEPLLEAKKLPVTQGFIASDEHGNTTTLSRGGSDYTATILAACLNAGEVQIWTDVDGVLTADPSLVPEARPIEVMSYQEAAELAYFGARVLHPKTLLPAVENGIPVWVRNVFRPESRGTCVVANCPGNGSVVKSIAYKEGVTLITIVSGRMFKAHGFLHKIFEIFDRLAIAPDLVATSEVSVAVAVHQPSNLSKLEKELAAFGNVQIHEGKAIVCVVGEQIRNQPEIAGRIFGAIPRVPISMISEGGSSINISFVCDECDLPYVVNSLHREFFPQYYRYVDRDLTADHVTKAELGG